MIYRMLLDWTKKVLPETKLILMEPFVLVTGAVEADWVADIDARRQVVKKIAADYGAVFLPLQEMFNRANADAPAPGYWLRDGVHPTQAGHTLIKRAWLRCYDENWKEV